MAHFAPPMQQMYDPTMIGAQAYMPAAMQQQQMAMQMQQQQHAAAAATQPHPPAHSHSGGGGGSSSKSKDSDKKGRKPYTITKPRESWTKEEHQLFLDALQLYERDWKRIGQHIPTKSIIQIRSHAQKHFIRLTKMGMKEYIPAPSRPKRKSPGKTKGGGKSKRQKTGGDEDEEGEEEGEDDEEADDGGDTGEGEGSEEQSHAVPPSPNSKAARSLHGLASMVKKEGEEGSARKKTSARGGGSARKAAPAVRRTQSVESSAGGEDGGDDGAGGASAATRRSGRQRKQKRKFEDEEYDDGDDIGEEEEEEEAPSTARRKAPAAKASAKHPTLDYDDEHALEYDDGQPHADEHDTGSNRQSPYTSQPPSNTNSAPSTPLRTGKVALSGHATGGGGINQLSQLSPLSQLSQATEIDLSAHMLPASSYNPKLKPYPGLHMRSSVMGRAPIHGTAISRVHHQLPSQLSVGNNATGEEGGEASGEDASQQQQQQPVQPEFAKVYSFLGSLFDPSTSGHIEELDKMTPVNKDIVQKLMQNLATNLSGNPSQSGVGSGYPSSGSSMPTGLSSDVPLHSLLGSGGSASRLLGAPKHMRTSSLGSIGSLDALSPDLGHRWIGMDQQPSVSPTPPQLGHLSASSLVGPSLTSAAAAAASGSLMGPNVSPTYLPRSFSSEGLTVSVIPPGSSTTASLGLSGVAPLPSSSSTWTTDKSRPGFASSALVSRLTARSALSPLSVAPLAGSSAGTWPTAASSPTAPNYGPYAGYAMGSPTMGTPMSFVGSPGGFFSPSMGAASSSAAGASASGATAPASAAESHIHQYPTVKTEPTTVPAANTGSVVARLPPSGSPPNAAAASSAAASSSAAAAAAASTAAASASSAVPVSAAASAAPSLPASISPGVVSPSHAGNILASLHSSPVPLAQPLVDPPAAPETAT